MIGMETSFEIKVDKNGKVQWKRPDLANDFLRSAAGRRWIVTFSPGRRSLSQNEWFHALFAEFSRKCGCSPAEAKRYCKAKYIEDGRGTSDLNWDEASEFGIYVESLIAELFG